MASTDQVSTTLWIHDEKFSTEEVVFNRSVYPAAVDGSIIEVVKIKSEREYDDEEDDTTDEVVLKGNFTFVVKNDPSQKTAVNLQVRVIRYITS